MAYIKASSSCIARDKKNLNIYELFLFTLLLFASFYSIKPAWSQSQNFASLNITDTNNENYLSPYLKQYTQKFNEENLSSIITAHHKGSNIKQNLNNLIYFGFDGQETWLSFEANNRSSSEIWHLDFGDYFSGRFGILDNVDIYVLDMFGNILTHPTKSKKQRNSIAKIKLPINQKSMVVFKVKPFAGLPTTLPLKIIAPDIKDNIEKKRLITTIIILLGLIGMIFFFAAFAIAKGNLNYAYFSVYYIAITIFLLLHSQVISSIPFIGGIVIPLFIASLSIVGLFISRLFWDDDIYSQMGNKLFQAWIICVVFMPIAGLLLPTNLSLFKTILYFGPAALLLLTIPILTLIKSTEARNQSMPFIFGWFLLLFGLSISAFSVSGLMPPLSPMLNAFWYALIPQVIFFTYALVIQGGLIGSNLPASRTVEISESETTSRVRQSKEQAEQDRLMKVIEQERRVLTELRKSEARRAEEMRKAKEEADLANRGKSAFLAVVTHEIRTPMTGIMGMVKMLLESGLDKKQKDYALTIQESSDAMLALLNDILDFEKIEQGKMPIESISFDLPRLIQGVVTLMNGHATQKNIELIANVDSSLPQFVKGDPTRLRQILLNLTGNAIKFTTEGSVTVKAQMIKKSPDGQNYEVYLGVTDSGVGISKEGQQKIFEAFSQADDSVSRKFGGTGLGLAISKGLVEAMGSTININSIEGEGSTFFFTLNMPVAQSKEPEAPKMADKLNRKDDIKPLQILVVDDNKINRKVILGFLENSPHTMDTAENANEAIEKIENGNYDLVFMDIEMPGKNGDEATIEIRHHSNPQVSNTPIIALTGNVKDEQIKSYLQSGMSGFLAKPIDPEKLKEVTIDAAEGRLLAPMPEGQNEEVDLSIPIPSSDIEKTDVEQIEEETSELPIIEEQEKSETEEIEKKPSISVSRTTSVKRTPPPMTSDDKDQSPLAQALQNNEDMLLASETSNEIDDIEVSPMNLNISDTPVVEADKSADTEINSDNNLSLEGKNIDQKNTTINENSFDEDILNTLKGHLDIGAIKSMIDEVFEKSDEIIDALKSANENKDPVQLHAKAHELKGMTGNFGLKELSIIAGDIEEQAKSEQFEGVNENIEKIPAALTSAKAAVENWLNS